MHSTHWNIKKYYLRSYIQDSFAKITGIKKVDICIKVVYNDYSFYNFILKRDN